MKNCRNLLLAIIALSCVACTEKHFISDAAYRSTVDSLFELKQSLAKNRETELFAVFSQNLSIEEREALQFLYAFMPIGDMADYNGDFYLQNVRSAFTTRTEMSWGKQIPDDIFRHFVLPVRVNNENMDNSRIIFHDELKLRVKHLSLHDAALEVNHWCHEKVTYTPSDSRTSAPLASVRSAIGRCGEESTFTVAAMRSVGIPARQVYTPRWAHTDDNHAWIEVWVDGGWHYMGACEPEPVLDLGWFSSPAQRAMLLHTKVFGKYTGKEDIIAETPCYTEINVIDNYAPVKKIHIKVVDAQQQLIQNAPVDFGLYNYAEFYPIATKKTNNEGIATLTVGLGDLLIWARKDGLFGYEKLSVKNQDEITVVIDKKESDIASLDIDSTPPEERPVSTKVTDEQRRENEKRFQEEDNIRKQYEAGFYTQQKAAALAAELNTDAVATWKYMEASRGNFSEIETFLRETTAENRAYSLDLLGVIAVKDLRDTPHEVLSHHLLNSLPFLKIFPDQTIFTNYVMNPRVANELLTAYRTSFDLPDGAVVKEITENPEKAISYFSRTYSINDNFNPQRIPITVKGFAALKVGDTYSASIAVVAFLRSLGIAARIEPATQKLQYYHSKRWNDFSLTKIEAVKNPPQGKLFLSFTSDETLKMPKYEIHYTLSKFTNGKFNVLGLDVNDEIFGQKSLINKPVTIDAGYYLLTTGRRLANGGVLSHLEFFTIKENKTTNLPLKVRYTNQEVVVIGSMNPESKFVAQGTAEPESILKTTGRGFFVIALLDAKKEPTNHALQDIAAVSEELKKWGRPMVFIFKNEAQLKTFDKNEFKNLPSTITFGYDNHNEIYDMLKQSLLLTSDNMPLFVVADSFGRVVFISQGYRIGLGEQLMNVIKKL